MSTEGGNGDKSSGQAQITLMNSEKSCTILEVRDVLGCCPSSDQLWLKLTQVARSLKIPDDQVILINTKLRMPKVMELFGTRTEGDDLITPTEALYQILEIWQNVTANPTLITLIKALNKNGLRYCSDALTKHFNEFDDAYMRKKLKELGVRENLPEYLKSWMNMKSVEFQGKKLKLEQLVNQITTLVDRKIADELVSGKTPCIVNDPVPKQLNYYVERTVRRRNILKKNVLKERCNDVFVIEGMDKQTLSMLLPHNESTDVSGNQLMRITVRFILLQYKSDFGKICSIASTPVHWVKFENGRLEFVKSSGSVENLQKHVDYHQDSFNEIELACRPERVVIIADSPGMGKTSLLANIAHQIMREKPTILIRFIVVKEFVDALAKKKINIESIVKVIAEQSSEYEFGRKFVENVLKTQSCVLLFDGLDEVVSSKIKTYR